MKEKRRLRRLRTPPLPLLCTIKYYSVSKQYSVVPVRVNWNDTKYRCGSMRECMPTIVLCCTLLYCILLYYTVHSTIHQNYSRGTYIIVLKYIGPLHPASLRYGDQRGLCNCFCVLCLYVWLSVLCIIFLIFKYLRADQQSQALPLVITIFAQFCQYKGRDEGR